MEATFETTRKVEFGDTDMAGIVHFSNFFRYMEEAEHEFLQSVGLNVVLYDDSGTFGFPKLQADCKFKHPARLNDVLTISAGVNWSDGKSIRYDFKLTCEGKRFATGLIHVACCRFPNDGLPYPILIPDFVLQRLQTAVDG